MAYGSNYLASYHLYEERQGAFGANGLHISRVYNTLFTALHHENGEHLLHSFLVFAQKVLSASIAKGKTTTIHFALETHMQIKWT